MIRRAITFSSIRKDITQAKNVHHVNRGGCGFFACFMYEKYEIENPEIFLITSNPLANHICIQDFTAAELNRMKIYLSHIVVKIKNCYIDASGIFSDYHDTFHLLHEDEIVILPINITTLKRWLKEEHIWCNLFDRKIALKQLEQIFYEENMHA